MIVAITAASGFAGVSGRVSAQEPVAADAPETPLNYDEKAAQGIDGMLMCPVCPSQTIDQAHVPIAKQMRQLVRQKLAQGESRLTILASIPVSRCPALAPLWARHSTASFFRSRAFYPAI